MNGRVVKVAVYTAVFGGFDVVEDPVPQDLEADWVCFTDDITSVRGDRWTPVKVRPRYGNPRMDAKWFKAVPHLALPDYPWTIWVDANARIDAPYFVREALSYADAGIALWRHPQRDCIYDEARVLLDVPAHRSLPVAAQIRHYRSEGYPRHAGLYACGTIVRNAEVAAVCELGDRWLTECEEWTSRDQLSFPVVARRLGIRPSTFPHHLHRHTLAGATLCRLRRNWWLDAIGRRARRLMDRMSGGPQGRLPALRVDQRWLESLPAKELLNRGEFRGNPWFYLAPHVGSARGR